MTPASRFRRLLPEASKFLTVGGLAYIVDVGVFNLVLFGSSSVLGEVKPLTAKTISTIVATLVAYLGNRNWTYAERNGRAWRHELFLFLLANAAAMAIALLCLWTSHYLLGLQSPVADNFAANVVGVGLGTIFRFFVYRKFVFRS